MSRFEQLVVFVLESVNVFVKLALEVARRFLQVLQCFDASLYFLGQSVKVTSIMPTNKKYDCEKNYKLTTKIIFISNNLDYI